MSTLPRIILGISGPWADRSEITTAIMSQSGGYLFAGKVMLHMKTGAHCEVDIAGPDPRMRAAFEVAGGGSFSSSDLDAIAQHRSTIYLIGDGGSFENARTMMQAAQAMLRCGGFAVKVESAGIAHSAEGWSQLTEEPLPHVLLRAFVTYVGQPGEFYSCGMHNLGFRDAIVTAPISSPDAAHLLHTFVRYIALEEPTMQDGETFAVAADAPRYRLTRTDHANHDPEDTFYNPYGMWNLAPVL